MFARNENQPIVKVDAHNQIIAQNIGLNPKYLQQLANNDHPDSLRGIGHNYVGNEYHGNYRNNGLYFHICNLENYLTNFQKRKYPSLEYKYIRDTVLNNTTQGLQELKNLHTGYQLIRYSRLTINEVKAWTEADRNVAEKKGCMLEFIASQEDLNFEPDYRIR